MNVSVESDDTVNSLSKHIKIPIIKIDYGNVEEYLGELVKLKDKYNKMNDYFESFGVKGDDYLDSGMFYRDLAKEAEEVLVYLFADILKAKRLHALICLVMLHW